jgi:hypothetical protein
MGQGEEEGWEATQRAEPSSALPRTLAMVSFWQALIVLTCSSSETQSGVRGACKRRG